MPPETQPTEAVTDTVIEAEPTIEERLAATQDPSPEEPQPEGDQPEDVPEADGEDDEIEVEAEDIPPIQAPVSWTAEEKEEFGKLPREMQDVISRREGEREKFLQTKSQEARQAEIKANEQALGNIQQLRQEHEMALLALLPNIPEKPSYALQAQDPHLFAALMDQHETAVAQHNAIAQRVEIIAQQAQAKESEVKQQRGQYEVQLLQEKFPEYLDTEKGPELRQALRSTAHALGYSDDQLAQSDAHDVLAMKQISEWKAKADKFDIAMTKQMQRVRDGKNPPAITRPGAPQAKGAATNQRYAADRQAMRDGDKSATTRVFSRFV